MEYGGNYPNHICKCFWSLHVTVGNGTPSNLGSSLSFNGSSTTVNVSNNSVTGSDGFVVSFDFYSSNLPADDNGDPNYTIVDQGPGGQWGIQYAEENGTLRFQVKTASWYTAEIPVLENTWYRIVAQYDKANNSIDFYKDGLLVDGTGVSGNLTSFSGYPGMRIGREQNWNFTIDDFYISSDVSEASSLRNPSAPTLTTNTLVYYDFNEGSGNVLNDLSSNNLDGTITDPSWNTIVNTHYLNNCKSTDQITVSVNSLPTIDLGADTTLICAGNSETLDAGTGFTSYLWSDGSTESNINQLTLLELILLMEPMPMDVRLVIAW